VSEVRADRFLELARSRIERLSPEAAWSALQAGEALMIDIRSTDARAEDGVVPGSVHIPRTVLEWRLDTQCQWGNPLAAGTDRRIVLVCDHGYSSSLAAAGLVDLGYTGATDVEGGIDAWREAGLPLTAAADAILAPGELPGMRGPEAL